MGDTILAPETGLEEIPATVPSTVKSPLALKLNSGLKTGSATLISIFPVAAFLETPAEFKPTIVTLLLSSATPVFAVKSISTPPVAALELMS